VVLLVNGLRPYFDIALRGAPRPGESVNLDDVRSISEVVEVEGPVTKWTRHGEKRHWRVYADQPYSVRRLRKKLEDWEVTSADIPFQNRLMLDLDLGPHINARGDVLWAGERAPDEAKKGGTTDRQSAEVAIAEAGGAGIYPVDMIVSCDLDGLSRAEPFPAPFVTFSFDLETSIATNRILCAAAVVDRAGVRSEYEFKGEEREIMEGLTSLVRESDPDFVTGYNIDNFDLPRMEERAEVICPRPKYNRSPLFGWGRVPMNEGESKRIFPTRQQNRVWRIPGRIPMDAWWQARQTLRPQRESLRYVSQLLWPDDEEMQKLDVDASKMDEEWASRPDVVMEYCVRDTHLPLDILGHLKAVARKEALASVSLTAVETAANGTTSQWIDSLVMRLADKEGIAVPMTNAGPRKRDQIAGGYVHEVEPGMEPWIVVLDFKSMYPSIMISNNICSTTLVRDGQENSSHSISPTTRTRYKSKEEMNGLVPRLLEDLMAKRDLYKMEMEEAQAKGDEVEAFLLDQLQYAVKILMNSFYGVFASSFYRFTHPDLGASITEWARHNIKAIISQVEEGGNDVIYSDTDSIFVKSPVDQGAPTNKPEDQEGAEVWSATRDETLKFGEGLAQMFTKEGAELEFETALSAFFSHGAKKRYVGRVVWPREEMLIRGYEVRRTDSFDLLSETMTQMFEMLLDGDTEGAVDMTKLAIDEVRSGSVDPSRLVISRSCKGKWNSKKNEWDFSIYSNPDGLPYVRAAKQRISAGLQFTPGMKVGYIITEPDPGEKKLGVSAWLVDEIGGEPPEYDRDYYAKRLAKSLGRITEAFGVDEKELLKGARPKGQSSIFDF
jgi:DNA polymerase I|tara:strand:- start:3454 stop:5961 length:2508 start_codon:yes stop_codon:yes gene_type:complete